MNQKLSIKSENLSYDKHYDEIDVWNVYFTYNLDAIRDLFRVKDIPNDMYVSYIGLSAEFDLQTQTFDDTANIFAITGYGDDVEYTHILTDMEKLYLKEELISEGLI